jgi:hypothetical protein
MQLVPRARGADAAAHSPHVLSLPRVVCSSRDLRTRAFDAVVTAPAKALLFFPKNPQLPTAREQFGNFSIPSPSNARTARLSLLACAAFPLPSPFVVVRLRLAVQPPSSYLRPSLAGHGGCRVSPSTLFSSSARSSFVPASSVVVGKCR